MALAGMLTFSLVVEAPGANDWISPQKISTQVANVDGRAKFFDFGAETLQKSRSQTWSCSHQDSQSQGTTTAHEIERVLPLSRFPSRSAKTTVQSLPGIRIVLIRMAKRCQSREDVMSHALAPPPPIIPGLDIIMDC